MVKLLGEYNKNYIPDDIPFDGDGVDIESIDLATLHMLLRRAPIMAYSLSGQKREELAKHIDQTRDKGATNKRLMKMLNQGKGSTFTVLKRVNVAITDILCPEALQGLFEEKKYGRDEIAKRLQGQMFFSAKSSLCQSATFTTCTIESVIPPKKDKVFHTLTSLTAARVNLIVGCAVDDHEHPFLQQHVKNAKLKVGRMVPLRRQVDREVLMDQEKVGCLYSMLEDGEIVRNDGLEIILGDETQLFNVPDVDKTGALLVPLCPKLTRKSPEQPWKEARKIKEYPIQEPVVKEVLSGKSRHALKDRNPKEININGFLKRDETKILEVPLDIGSFDADIGVVCVDKDGNEIDVIHFPATYLDRIRTYPDGENRVQVEIKNTGSKPIALKDIYFRVRFYETDKTTREKWQLRKALQDIGRYDYYAVEHLIYTQVLDGQLGGGLTDKHKKALADLINLDNLFMDGRGLLFYEKDTHGKKEDACLVITKTGIIEREIKGQNMTQRELIRVLKDACSVGREKRRIAIFRNDIGMEGLQKIITDHGITDILSIPGQREANEPTAEFVALCERLGKLLTSLNIIPAESKNDDDDLDLVGHKREEKTK